MCFREEEEAGECGESWVAPLVAECEVTEAGSCLSASLRGMG